MLMMGRTVMIMYSDNDRSTGVQSGNNACELMYHHDDYDNYDDNKIND
jgi:hypothetical protein